MNQQQPLNYRLLTWDKYIQNMVGLNMFVIAKSS